MIEQTILETIRQRKLIEKDEHIIVGLSGGPDSVCLFDVLEELAYKEGWNIHVVHVNHKFRPGAAEEDQAYVEQMCRDAGVDCKVYVYDCAAIAEEKGISSEEAGRMARYEAFSRRAKEIAQEYDVSMENVKVAVAHNYNDQAETVLFRILRGTGMDGIAGMAYEREERREDGTFTVVRPLLDTWREEVEAYCEENSLDPVTDHTNNEGLYTRNRLRLDLIPYIEEHYNSNFQEGLVRMAKIAAADKDYFWEETARAYRMLRTPEGLTLSDEPSCEVALDWRGLANCHEALRHRIILKAFDEIGLIQDITAERLEAADKVILGQVGGKTVEFPHGYSLRVGKGKVLFVKE